MGLKIKVKILWTKKGNGKDENNESSRTFQAEGK